MLSVLKERSHSDVIQKSFRCHSKSIMIWMFTLLNALFHISFHVAGTFTESSAGVLSRPCFEPTRGSTAQSRWIKLASYQPCSHKLAACILKLTSCRGVACGCISQPLTHQPHPWKPSGSYARMELPETLESGLALGTLQRAATQPRAQRQHGPSQRRRCGTELQTPYHSHVSSSRKIWT